MTASHNEFLSLNLQWHKDIWCSIDDDMYMALYVYHYDFHARVDVKTSRPVLS